MKNITLIIFAVFFSISSSAQKFGDTITMSVDTINLHGVVIDENRKPVANAEIFVLAYEMSSRYTSSNWKAKTNNVGYFALKGIKPLDTLFIYTTFGKEKIINNGSRYLIITARQNNIIEYKSPSFNILAPRRIKKTLANLKVIYKNFWHEPEDRFDEPEYPGRGGKLWEYIKNNINYPEIAIQKNIEGVVVLEFIVSKSGQVLDVQIVRDIGYGCGEEAMRVIKSSKKWNSAMQNGKPIDRRISIQIPFKLTD